MAGPCNFNQPLFALIYAGLMLLSTHLIGHSRWDSNKESFSTSSYTIVGGVKHMKNYNSSVIILCL